MDEPRLRVTVEPHGWTFETAPDQSLLQAGLAAGVRLPHSCRNGTCRACITQLRSGEISYRIEWPGLSREEKAEGWILPCVACARSDLVLDAPQATRPAAAPRPTVLTAPKPPVASVDVSPDTLPTTTQK
ncbi:2Fe-2S iron-sulfur cluster-binding protein [Roseateles sp. YR242]|uniref:2Fe-2S iron-sulfur cluster-binding protein n=1 Tax=Roseateles sp. YR242 TaxID=1855305 RepID=UPI000B813154|nr:2Fe-2S iron-sulfur cluster-binding protein [Roseateles sp. YR242]